MSLIPDTPGVRPAQDRARILDRIHCIASTQDDVETSWLILDVFRDAGAITCEEAWELLSKIMQERF